MKNTNNTGNDRCCGTHRPRPERRGCKRRAGLAGRRSREAAPEVEKGEAAQPSTSVSWTQWTFIGVAIAVIAIFTISVWRNPERVLGFFRGILEMLIDKLRVNVVIVAILITWIIVDFGDKLIALLGENAVDSEAIVTTLALLIGVGIGGLITTMGRMFDSPSIPADTFERIIKRVDK